MRPTKKNRLTITIRKPVHDVFTFIADPQKSPLWVPGFVKEETSAWPVAEGTVYRNLNTQDEWNEYVVTAVEEDKLLILKKIEGDYHVRYTFRPVSDTETEIEYYEWANHRWLQVLFPQAALEKLKEVLEQT